MDKLKEWKEKQDLENGNLEEQEYAEKGLFKRFTDTGNFKLYKQKMDIAFVLGDHINGLPQRWRVSIKADKDVQSFQSENIEELKQVILMLSNIYVQMMIKTERAVEEKLSLFGIKKHLIDELMERIKIRPVG